MTTYTVSSGVTSNGLVLTSGNAEDVLAGGKATNTTVSSGGLQNVSSGGTASGTTAYGEQQVFAGGVAYATTVEAGGVLYGNGSTESGTVVENRGLEQIGSASTDINATISSGGVQWAYTSTTVSGATLNGGTQILGGLTSSTEFGALATAGGTAIGNVVDSGGEEFVGTGATASGTILNSGGQQQVGGSTEWTYYYTAPTGAGVTMSTNLSGGIASNTTVNSGGDQIVSSGGTAIGTTLYGEEQVVSGVASATTIEAGGALLAGSSTMSGTVVLSRGLEQLGVASVDSGTTVSAGGAQWLYNSAAATDATLNGGIQVIGGVTSSTSLGDISTTTGGTATGTVVNSGGAEYVGTDATASDTLVTSGGTQQVGGSTEWRYYYQVSAGVSGSTMSTNLSGGIVSGTMLSAGSPHGSGTETQQIVGSGGTAIGTILESYAVQRVSAGGVASGTAIDSGNVQAVASGGTSINAVVNSGGLEQGAGTTSGTTVNTGGVEYAVGGGSLNGTTLSGGVQIAGGTQSSTLFGSGVLSGTASGTVVSAGGTQYVGSAAVVKATVVDSGGKQQIGGTTSYAYDYAPGTTVSVNLSGGTASGTTVNSDGTEIVSSGGTASGTTVNSGGLVQVVSGGSITGTDLLSGGTINLEYATYSAGATAVLNAGTDVLTVTDGGNTYTLQMAGSYTGEGFEVTSATDGTVDVILCFYPGTQLAGTQGGVAVEDITAGTMLKTASGALMPVRWVGQSQISTRFADRQRSLPIRIRAGALGDNLPQRDLLVSPDHALFIEGLLIQAGALVNGVSIIREINVPEQFTYYHVELARHDLLLAEGVPAESFVDNVDRLHFHNWAEHEALVDLAPTGEMPYPRVKAHRQVPQAVRQMLADRVGSVVSTAAA
jgi:autotransporter passenger strand-loop-strand repeat protein